MAVLLWKNGNIKKIKAVKSESAESKDKGWREYHYKKIMGLAGMFSDLMKE